MLRGTLIWNAVLYSWADFASNTESHPKQRPMPEHTWPKTLGTGLLAFLKSAHFLCQWQLSQMYQQGLLTLWFTGNSLSCCHWVNQSESRMFIFILVAAFSQKVGLDAGELATAYSWLITKLSFECVKCPNRSAQIGLWMWCVSVLVCECVWVSLWVWVCVLLDTLACFCAVRCKIH